MNDALTSEEIKTYYDLHTIGKLKGFLYSNYRVERAWSTLIEWQDQPPKNILEIGCGIGDIAWRASNIWQDSSVTAFDISEKSIEIGKKLFNKSTLSLQRHDNVDKLVFNSNAKFDLIYLIDVYEHIPMQERQDLFNFIKKNLASEGSVFLSCPTIKHQNWLKQNMISGLQPIDYDITMTDLMELSNGIQRNIFLYKEVSVWNRGDYFHAILGNKDYQAKFPVIDIPLSRKTIKSLFRGKFNKNLIRRNTSTPPNFKQRKKLLIDCLGVNIISDIDNYVI